MGKRENSLGLQHYVVKKKIQLKWWGWLEGDNVKFVLFVISFKNVENSIVHYLEKNWHTKFIYN